MGRHEIGDKQSLLVGAFGQTGERAFDENWEWFSISQSAIFKAPKIDFVYFTRFIGKCYEDVF